MAGSADPRPPSRTLEAGGQLKGAGSLRVGGNTPRRSHVGGRTMAQGTISDRLHLRRTTEQHVPEVGVQVKRRRTASLSSHECPLYPRRSQQQEPVVDFQAELRQAFLAETPRGG
ncbi:SNRPN upstream reading frame protein-like [Pteropus vampyrus]|uniref:SNRPN upstream reading frame protein-like n=1 Tax=Pteropus vampyrus TaxID=132908 RepID=A0A6P6C299_PTEVA|nr:SNRPN upstream reading frame protein-like [Pteropus vampyrus]XP_023381542.1 SNRPN upstream reading frame protein-like [Pteropus vampyrus]